MKLETEVRLIPTSATLKLRQRILRPLQTPEECTSPRDNDPLTFHVGLYHAGVLAAVATFQPEIHPDFAAGFPYRLRWMAVCERYRRRNFGTVLLNHGIEILRARHCDLLWFNARKNAFKFYEGMGCWSHGGLFEIEGVGPHKVMYKHLPPR